MNNFVKFPLVLGIVGIICTGALSLVYELTDERIAYNKNKVAIELMGTMMEDVKNAEPVLEAYDKEKASKLGISNMYEVSDSNGIAAYGYMVDTMGQNAFTILVVLDSEESMILGVDVVAHSETPAYGGLVLSDPNYINQFKNISFDGLFTDVDGVSGSTKTCNGVVLGVDNAITFHREEIFQETIVDDGVNLNNKERKELALPEGYTMVDKTEEFKTTLKSKVSNNIYKGIVDVEVTETSPYNKLWNFVEIIDASGNIKGYAYIGQNNYNCEVEDGKKSWQYHKVVVMFDENWENSKVVVVTTTDSLAADNKPSIASDPWVDATFGNKSFSQLADELLGENSEVDLITGATFSSTYLKNIVAFVVNAHQRAYGNAN